MAWEDFATRDAYNNTMYVLAALLIVGFIANLCIKAVDRKHHMSDTAP